MQSIQTSVCTHAFIPVRSEPAEQAPLETQLLFGEGYRIVERTNRWCRIKCLFDGYEGWIDEKLVAPLSHTEAEDWNLADGWLVPGPYWPAIKKEDESVLLLPAGAKVVLEAGYSDHFSLGNQIYQLEDVETAPTLTPVQISAAFLNAPYLWGGRTFYGIDCSGLVQVVYKLAGIPLPRNASQQVIHGQKVASPEEAAPGDLAFFVTPSGSVNHVGICLGQGRIIHASGSVRIDQIDQKGIYNREKQSYTHTLKIIKRLPHVS